MDQDPYSRLRSDLWKELREYRGKPVDYGLMRHALDRTGLPFDWRAALVVGDMLSTHGEFSLSPHVVEFVARYAAARRFRSVLDPFVRVPSLLAAAAEASGSERAVGYIRSLAMAELARDIEGSDVTWEVDDFLRSERPPVTGFDFIVCAPPLGLRFNEIKGDGELALLQGAAKVVAPDGEIAFLVSEGFNFSNQAARARQQLADSSIHQVATVAVADAARETAIPLQLVVFRHGDAPQDIFVARLTAQMDVGQVVNAVIERRNAPTVELGRTVKADAYSNWESFAARAELERLLQSSQYPAARLGDISSSIRRVVLDAGDAEFQTAANAIYLTEIRGMPSLTPDSEGAKQRPYVEVCLDPERASAGFVLAWLGSPVGRLARESVLMGATIPRLSARSAQSLPIILPPLGAQLDAIRVEGRLTSLSLQAAELRARLWANPGAASRIEESLPATDAGEGLDAWIESLPFPLASIAYRYIADAAIEDKIDRLLHLFEATAEFAAALLLSAVRADADLYESERARLARPDPDGNPLLDRGTFGSWLQTGQTLAKTLRRLLSEQSDRERALRLFSVRDERFAQQLVEKKLWQVLDQARVVRNTRSHGGIEGTALRLRTLERLEGLLLELREALGPAFIGVDLIQPGAMQLRQGVFTHQARRLMGPNAIFRLRELESVVPLDTQHLYVVDADGVAAGALQVLPFFRMMSSPGTEQNAIYFYNSRGRDGMLKYVSYHFEAQPESAVDDPFFASLLDDLSPPRA